MQADGSTQTIRHAVFAPPSGFCERGYYAVGGVTVAMRENTTWSYFLTDNLGSVVGVTDSSGNLVSESRYLPFGEVRTDVGTITQTPMKLGQADFGYTFQRSIADTGLMDYRARMYDPTIGRFVQPDSLVPSAGSSQAFNRYSYVNNAPINFNDPTGNCTGYSWCYIPTNPPASPTSFTLSPTPPTSILPTQVTSTSMNGYNFIEAAEKFVAWPYNDNKIQSASNYTIGYGDKLHDGPCNQMDTGLTIIDAMGRTITLDPDNGLSQNEAFDLLVAEVKTIDEPAINKVVKVPLSQQQYDALVSFVFNTGHITILANSYLNEKQYAWAMNYLQSFDVDGQKNILPALVNRRQQEMELFLNGDYDYAK